MKRLKSVPKDTGKSKAIREWLELTDKFLGTNRDASPEQVEQLRDAGIVQCRACGMWTPNHDLLVDGTCGCCVDGEAGGGY